MTQLSLPLKRLAVRHTGWLLSFQRGRIFCVGKSFFLTGARTRSKNITRHLRRFLALVDLATGLRDFLEPVSLEEKLKKANTKSISFYLQKTKRRCHSPPVQSRRAQFYGPGRFLNYSRTYHEAVFLRVFLRLLEEVGLLKKIIPFSHKQGFFKKAAYLYVFHQFVKVRFHEAGFLRVFLRLLEEVGLLKK